MTSKEKRMKIEIGKEYTITNKYKKSYVEFEYFKDDHGDLIKVETGWRSGTWTVTPQDQHEIDMLVAASSDEYDDELCIMILKKPKWIHHGMVAGTIGIGQDTNLKLVKP
jgi:hypothetical protein